MSIKTILLHLADDPRNAARTASAIALAGRHDAHLVGLYTVTRRRGVAHQQRQLHRALVLGGRGRRERTLAPRRARLAFSL
ncbi:MAG: hypothetical protein O2995_08225, partial [Proteobacteria bacterium]|nr:hypothetical protein [Pseudomonadota bacterium]